MLVRNYVPAGADKLFSHNLKFELSPQLSLKVDETMQGDLLLGLVGAYLVACSTASFIAVMSRNEWDRPVIGLLNLIVGLLCLARFLYSWLMEGEVINDDQFK